MTRRFKDADASSESFPMPEMDSNGVDRAQIRRHLALTPSEGLRALETFLASIMQIRRGVDCLHHRRQNPVN